MGGMIHQGSVRSTTKNEGTICELTLKLKTTRTLIKDNSDNFTPKGEDNLDN